MRLTVAFGLLGFVLAGQAVWLAGQATGIWWVLVGLEIDLAICSLALASIYGFRAAGVGVEEFLSRPAWRSPIRWVLLPYLVIGGITLFLARWFDREGLLNPLTPGLFIGRLPFPFERDRVRASGVDAVLNLCWEFPRLSAMDREAGIESANVPILDGSPPTDHQFREAIRRVHQWRAQGRRVLIHCAQGHGRTATIAAAVLVQLGLANGVEEALAMVKNARPLARPSKEQRRALVRFLEDDPRLDSLCI